MAAMNYKRIEKAIAENSDIIKVRKGKGSHYVMRGPDGSVMEYMRHNKDYGPGLSCKLRKWFLRFGILLSLAYMVYTAVTL